MNAKSFWESTADELNALEPDALVEVLSGAMYDSDTGLLIEDD
jgi:hypothetical protein